MMCRSNGEAGLPFRVGIDDPPANFDGGVISEIVRGFENHPGRIQGLCPASVSWEPMPFGLRAVIPNALTLMADIPRADFRWTKLSETASAGLRFASELALPAFLRD